MKGRGILDLLVFVCIAKMIFSFNIDLQHKFDEYDIGTESSMFGFAVSLINNKDTPLIVGAPDHNNKGAIFKCEANGGKCGEVIFAHSSGTTESIKSQTNAQKLGFSLVKVGKRIMACAPKFKVMLDTRLHGRISQPLGKCFVFDEDMKLKYSEMPCEDTFLLNKNNKLSHGFGYCLAGTSTTGMPVETNDPMFFLGTPGTRHTTGLVFSMDSDRAVLAAEKHREFNNNSLVGYSVSAGNVIDRSVFGDVITGAPRGNKLNGQALLYKYKNRYEFSWRTNILNPHEQIGSFFGGAVCVSDMNNDKKDDVLIGAPFYSIIRDEGRVYIFKNTGDSTYDDSNGSGNKYKGLTQSGYLDGDKKLGSRFGTTIVNVGDLNRDGYTDVAIGAPGGDIGAVFIYNGAEDGLKNEYSQVIYASTVPGTPKGFGISIASGTDVDGNKYNDIAIGAHLSGKAYVFKSRAVIQLTSSQRTNVSLIPSDTKKFNCLWKKTAHYCLSLDIELEYSGVGTLDSLELDVTFSLDHEAIRKRAFMISTSGKDLVSITKRTLTMEKEKRKQVPVVVFVKMLGGATSDIIDILQPIVLLTSFESRHDPRKCNKFPCGILSNKVQKVASEVLYEHKCGSDDICEPDLLSESSITFPNNPGLNVLLYGVVYDFLLTTRILNLGEPAYQARMNITFSSDFNVDRVEINGKAHPVWNVEARKYDKQLNFVFANPINKKDQVDIAVKFSVPLFKPSNITYTFNVAASSLGSEKNPTDNKEVLEVRAKVDACLNVKSDVSPPFVSAHIGQRDVQLNTNTSSEFEGTKVEHTFVIKNEAEVPVESLVANVSVVVAKDDVRLMCISEVSINGKPCKAIPLPFSCRKPTYNMIGTMKSNNKEKLKKAESRKFNCDNAKCITLICDVETISQGKSALISIKSRLFDSTFSNVYQTIIEARASLNFKSKAVDLFDHRKECKLTAKALLNVELMTEKREDVTKKIPFWVYIGSAVGAIFLLVLITIIMYKGGFFARKRPGEEEEETEAFNGIDEEEEDDQ